MKSIKQFPLYRWGIRCINKLFPEYLARKRFKMYFSRELNLDNPKDLNEKITWLSLYSDTSVWTKLADKYAVRQYVEECGLANILVEFYGKWEDANDIQWDSLPNSFVIKTNNGSGTVMIVKDKSSLNVPKVVKTINKWLKTPVGLETTEFHYTRMSPCIIIEELLDSNKQDTVSSSLIDYKFWCTNGQVNYIWCTRNRNKISVEAEVYDRNWTVHPEKSVYTSHILKMAEKIPRPHCLDEMITIAEKLAEGFPVVRVDLYLVGGKIYFGEMTFTSLGGTMNYFTGDFLYELGDSVDISHVNRIGLNRPKW